MGEEFEDVELSDCCRAEAVLVERFPGTRLDPPEFDYLCQACGKWCEPVMFHRSTYDGTLTDPETGEKGLEQTPNSPQSEGPDPDEE